MISLARFLSNIFTNSTDEIVSFSKISTGRSLTKTVQSENLLLWPWMILCWPIANQGGHFAGTWGGDMLQQQFSSNEMPVCIKKVLLWWKHFVPDTCCIKLIWCRFTNCARYNIAISVTCPPARVLFLQYACYGYTPRRCPRFVYPCMGRP